MARSNARARRRKASQAGSGKDTLRFFALGGLGEIGKNMYVLECGDDIVVVDSGLMFPDEEMLGIDFVIPDISYLEENKHRIRGLVLTHGHEDHIGALPFVLPKLDVPLYGTCLTLGMAQGKLAEVAPAYRAKLNEVKAGDVVELGAFSVRFIAVCHSIPDGVALAIRTPLGTVVHTGDFKFDATPIDDRPTDYSAFAELGREGVLLLLSDSTNVERGGFTPSERMVGRTLEQIFRLHRSKRIIMAAFASNLHRVQQMCDVSAMFNRKVVLMGRSMVNNVELARRLGYIKADDDLFLPQHEADSFPANRTAVLTTGSQGEPFSGLVLMSKGEHRFLNLGSKDLVVINATPIPGNEKLVSRTINRLFVCGCEVLYEQDRQLHVSGHASREELKMMLSLVKPQYFVPVHGEYRMLVRHAQLAEEVGVNGKNVFVLQSGDVLEITRDKAQAKGTVPAGGILVDGMALGEVEGSLLRERRELSEEGVVVVSLVVDRKFRLRGKPLVESRGAVHVKESATLTKEMGDAVVQVVEGVSRRRDRSEKELAEAVGSRVRSVLRGYSRSSPTILPMVTIVEEGA